MDRVRAIELMAQYLRPLLRPDQQYHVTTGARTALDGDRDGKVSRDELLEGLVKDEVSFDPRLRAIITNRSVLPVDRTILPRSQSRFTSGVEQCMEFVQRYFAESRARRGLHGPSFDVDFGVQHNLSGEVRQLAAGRLEMKGYEAFLNGGLTPPRAGDVLVAESMDGTEFHVALVIGVTKAGDRWQVTIYQANVPYGANSPRFEDHTQQLELIGTERGWHLTRLPTAQAGYGADMDVVGWIHPTGDKALPGAAP